MIRSPTTSRGRGRPTRTMATRHNPMPTTSGSGDQNLMAPDEHEHVEDAPLVYERLSSSPTPERSSRSAPDNGRRNTATHKRNHQLQENRPKQRPVVHTISRNIIFTARQPTAQENLPGRSGFRPNVNNRRTQTAAAPGRRQNVSNALSSLPDATVNDFRALLPAIRAPAPVLPSFSGHDHEDPLTFLRECEEHFESTEAKPSQCTRLAGKALEEPASKWWELFKKISVTWEKFKEILIQRYASAPVLMQLHKNLYSRKQGERENTAVFLQQRYLSARRLLPIINEEGITALLLESLRPSIRRAIRSASPRNFEDLFQRALTAETDEAEDYPRHEKKKEESKPREATPAAQTNMNQRAAQLSSNLPRCRFCPERHFHRNCPVLASQRNDDIQGNWRSPATAAAAMPPQHQQSQSQQ